jgi:two-component system nitrogen regulation response regulator NtrX
MSEMSKVLVVDDQVGICRFLEEALREANYHAISLSDSQLVLTKIHDFKPDIILLDMKMPRKSGLEVLREILEEKLTIPVIFMTAYGELQHINEARAMGIQYFLNKPFDISNLELLIQVALCKAKVS